MSSKHAPVGRTPSSQTWHLHSYLYEEVKSLVTMHQVKAIEKRRTNMTFKVYKDFQEKNGLGALIALRWLMAQVRPCLSVIVNQQAIWDRLILPFENDREKKSICVRGAIRAEVDFLNTIIPTSEVMAQEIKLGQCMLRWLVVAGWDSEQSIAM
ncbi:hypothetical protein ARMGADRAFT_1105290 [Armillaria gallica]|uniref:Uncharacterized protein n=1 Tax=Armillaria gallica TaxID=47427 RepID=A0A2H3DU51_ARMGA|nr:hypothetical protein ARMGADRAFT_1105290 [Armillaria gallica]